MKNPAEVVETSMSLTDNIPKDYSYPYDQTTRSQVEIHNTFLIYCSPFMSNILHIVSLRNLHVSYLIGNTLTPIWSVFMSCRLKSRHNIIYGFNCTCIPMASARFSFNILSLALVKALPAVRSVLEVACVSVSGNLDSWSSKNKQTGTTRISQYKARYLPFANRMF